MALLESRIRGLGERLTNIKHRARVVAKVAKNSGLLWELTVPGVKAAAVALARGAHNPAQVYRIHAANSPDKPAVLWRDKVLTYAQLDERMDKLALGLRRAGVSRGGSVILFMRNRPECYELQGATSRIGAAAVSVSWRSTASELVYLANHSGATAICYDADLASVVEQAQRETPRIPGRNLFAIGTEGKGTKGPVYEELLESDRNAFVQEKGIEKHSAVVIYTSGTTGKPKGAVRKFPEDALPAALRFISETPMRVDDIHLVTCPLYHSTALGFSTLSQLLGATVVILDEFKPELFLQAIERYGVTTTAVVPTMLHRVLALGKETLSKYDTRSLRVIFTGGAPLPGPLGTEVMDHFGDILFNFYGATETGLVTLAKPDDLRAAPWTIGKAVPGNDIRLLDDEGREVGSGEVGELYTKNSLLVAGYHKDDEATRSSMRKGYFSVGDLARKDAAGRYFIEGRKRDMVISGGVNVYPAEVESVIEAHSSVSEVAVIGVEDAEWGERVRAFVARKPGSNLEEGDLKLWCRERLAGPKVPRDFVFVDSLPRNPTGKVLKRDLRTWGKEG